MATPDLHRQRDHTCPQLSDCIANVTASRIDGSTTLNSMPEAENEQTQSKPSAMRGHCATPDRTRPSRSTEDYRSPAASQEELDPQEAKGYDTERVTSPEMDDIMKKNWHRTCRQRATRPGTALQQIPKRFSKEATRKQRKKYRTRPHRSQNASNQNHQKGKELYLRHQPKAPTATSQLGGPSGHSQLSWHHHTKSHGEI